VSVETPALTAVAVDHVARFAGKLVADGPAQAAT
jgi:hypothetical protein